MAGSVGCFELLRRAERKQAFTTLAWPTRAN
jgi:hypothetical protein